MKPLLYLLATILTSIITGYFGYRYGFIHGSTTKDYVPEIITDDKGMEPICTLCEKLPLTIFEPGGLFTDTEKEELTNKLVKPFFDFYNSESIEYVTLTIKKYDPLPAHGYKYEVTGVNINGGYLSFLFGQNTPLEWWLPECMGGCKFTTEFQTKYPEIVDALK